jgi:hypothetical protein
LQRLADDSTIDHQTEGTGAVDIVFIKVIIVVGSIVIWMALIFMAERQARTRHAAIGTPEPTETNRDRSQPA